MIMWNYYFHGYMYLCVISVFDGAPRTKQIIEATAGGMSGEASKEGVVYLAYN